MGQPILLGIHSVKGGGKDTTAGFIKDLVSQSEPPLSFAKRGFADKAKWAYARQFFPQISEQDAVVWVDNYKNTDAVIAYPDGLDRDELSYLHTPFRLHMAQFATDSAREIYGKNHWVDQLLPTRMTFDENDLPFLPAWVLNFLVQDENPKPWHESSQYMTDVCAITDERFDNEVERVHVLGGYNVKIRRHDAEMAVIEEARLEGREVHVSELGLPDEKFDIIIVNDDNDMTRARERTAVAFELIQGWVKNNQRHREPRRVLVT